MHPIISTMLPRKDTSVLAFARGPHVCVWERLSELTTHRVWVSMDVFEGSGDAWRLLKVGDVLRVEAEEDNYKKKGKDEAAPWKANEAILIRKANADTSKMRKEAKKEAEVQ